MGAIQLDVVNARSERPWMVTAASCGLFALPAFAIAIPKGILPFGVAILATTLIGFRELSRGARDIAWPLAVLVLVASLAMGVALFSSLRLGLDPGDIGNLDRMIGMAWCALWAYALRPSRDALWWGALAGIAAACAIALLQVLTGADRASGWGNAIVFGNVVVALMVLAVFCRPARTWRWTGIALAAGFVTILLSGTRGTWPALFVLLVALILGCGWRSARTRALLLGGTLLAVVVAVASIPQVRQQMRLTELQHDIARMDQGDHNSSAGARMERLGIAAQAFWEQPLTGVGFSHFDLAVAQALPECRTSSSAGDRCHLGHAHNDLAEWAATMGIPGILALLAIYGVPAWMFLQLRRRTPAAGRLRGSADAGLMLVIAFALCGLTQSVFAHQTTTSIYAGLVGLLLGLALREARPTPSTPAA